jgi:hypothetical protein
VQVKAIIVLITYITCFSLSVSGRCFQRVTICGKNRELNHKAKDIIINSRVGDHVIVDYQCRSKKAIVILNNPNQKVKAKSYEMGVVFLGLATKKRHKCVITMNNDYISQRFKEEHAYNNVLLHELGHCLGSGHLQYNTNQMPLMYAYVNTAQTMDFTDQDVDAMVCIKKD